MAEARGGYREPANPAPVSGPGSLSQRTDGGPADTQPVRVAPGGDYGDRQELEAAQRAAPLPQRTPVDTSGIVPMTAPTANPGQDITAGAVVPNQPEEPGEYDMFRLGTYLNALKTAASRPNASPASRQLVRQLEARMGQRRG